MSRDKFDGVLPPGLGHDKGGGDLRLRRSASQKIFVDCPAHRRIHGLSPLSIATGKPEKTGPRGNISLNSRRWAAVFPVDLTRFTHSLNTKVSAIFSLTFHPWFRRGYHDAPPMYVCTLPVRLQLESIDFFAFSIDLLASFKPYLLLVPGLFIDRLFDEYDKLLIADCKHLVYSALYTDY